MQAINLYIRLFLPKEDLVEFETGAIVTIKTRTIFINYVICLYFYVIYMY